MGIEAKQVTYVIRFFAYYCALMQAAPNGQRTKVHQSAFQQCKSVQTLACRGREDRAKVRPLAIDGFHARKTFPKRIMHDISLLSCPRLCRWYSGDNETHTHSLVGFVFVSCGVQKKIRETC